MDDGFKLYMREVQQARLLTRDEELALARRTQRGDLRARNEMILHNLRLVVSIAKRYAHRGLGFLDLIEEGNMGLMNAVEQFDPSRGCRFSTYAYRCIHRAIQRGLLHEALPVRVPPYMVKLASRWRQAEHRLESQYARPPTDAEVRRATGVSAQQAAVVSRTSRALSVPAQAPSDDADRPFAQLLVDDTDTSPAEQVFQGQRLEAILKAMSLLDERSALILRLRFGLGGREPMTLKEIGRQIGLTRERVRQIEVKTLRGLGDRIRNQEQHNRLRHSRHRGL